MSVRLLVVHGRPQGKSLLFRRGEFVFGRGSECHIRPNSDWVSRQHCMLHVTPDGVRIRDLGSRNGTLVNGTRVVGERPLQHGDQLQVGPLVFEVQLDQPAEAKGLTPAQNETGVFCVETAQLPPAAQPPASAQDFKETAEHEVPELPPVR